MMFQLLILLCLIRWKVLLTEHLPDHGEEGVYGERQSQPVCVTPFFMPPDCRFKCYCSQGQCEADGSCKENTRCQRGYFGSKCQYVDLAHLGFSSSHVVVDNDDSTCLSGDAYGEIVISLQSNFSFSFTRIVVANEEYLDTIRVNVEPFGCPDVRGFYESRLVRDIYCNIRMPFRNIVLTGVGVNWLCSVYISGGRNVALRQAVVGTNVSMNLNYTVDGVVPAISDTAEDKCFQSNMTSYVFNITLERPMLINRIIVYIKKGNMKEELGQFKLVLVPAIGAPRFKFNETLAHFNERLTYLVPVPQVVKTLMFVKTAEGVLRICEVEIYGDCQQFFYGLNCSEVCDESCQRSICSPVHGNCMDCQSGKYDLRCSKDCPEKCSQGCSLLKGVCRACENKFYGQECKKQCSLGCMNDGSCSQTNGSCTYSCFPGYVGDDCQRCSIHCLLSEETCHPKTHRCLLGCTAGRYGPTCNGTCSKYCKNSDCDINTGVCRGGCQIGFHGALCVEACCNNCLDGVCNVITGHCLECIPGKRGERCQLNCSAQCLDDKCDRVDGSCQAGCKPPYSGLHCDKLCQNCAGNGQCSQQSMVCALGCKSGYEGETCVIPSTPSAIIPILLIASCLISTMISIIYLYWRRISRGGVYSNE